MGNFEKLVVLTILFLSVIVLAFSLNEEDGVEAAGPLESARQQAETGVPGGPSGAPAEPSTLSTEELDQGRLNLRTSPEASDRLLSAEIGAGNRTPTPDPDPASSTVKPAGGKLRILRDDRGLEPTALEDYLVYEVEQGDTWNALTRRFYRDSRYLHLLRSANEELEVLRAGDTILVPVHDLAREAGTRDPYRPAPEREVIQEPVARPGGVYVVQDGDNLSSISEKVYGTANRWHDIYEANKDVLQSADWLELGVRLKLPPK